MAGRQRSSALCFAIWGTPAPWAVCPEHPAHLFVLRCAFRPLADRGRYGPSVIGEALVACFLSEHLPACACPYPVRRLRHELRAALARLLAVLRADGVGTLDPALDSAVSRELVRFDDHMRDVWGLADNTRRRRGRVVGEFLLAHFGDQPITMSTISVASVRRFVLGEHGRSAGLIAVIGGAIGCYLRFRSMSGDRVSELVAAIPRAAHWRLASLPEVLTDAEMTNCCDHSINPFRHAGELMRWCGV